VHYKIRLNEDARAVRNDASECSKPTRLVNPVELSRKAIQSLGGLDLSRIVAYGILCPRQFAQGYTEVEA
jgi:hypothetical protein